MRRSQVSLEYAVMTGLLLVVSAPFFYHAFSASQDAGSYGLEHQLDRLGDAVRSVAVQGEPARTSVLFRVPSNVAPERCFVANNTIVYGVETAGGYRDYLEHVGGVRCLDGDLPTSPGVFELRVLALDGCVSISVVD